MHALALHLRVLRGLREDELSPQALAELCAPMDAAMRAMSSQLTRLLQLSRLEAGEARVSLRSIAVDEVMSAVAAHFGLQAQDKGLRLRMQTQARVHAARVHSVPKMLQSIIDNLVSNAVLHTERGGVLLAARRRGGQLLFQVFDTGPGIAAEQLPQIFIAYRRFDDRDRESHDGSGQGLGLALARKQPDLLSHTLAVRSVPERGSVFSLAVPLAAPA